MIDRAQLPYILELVQDDSPVVREHVAGVLAGFGPGLERELDLLSRPPDLSVRVEIELLLREHGQQRTLGLWQGILDHADDAARLEGGLGLVSELLSGPRASSRLRWVLNGLAEEYRAEHARPHALTLARFLFRERGLRGEREHYYDPANSDLLQVLRKGSGIPITLACAYILVGHRLELPLEGCNFPGHFLARARMGDDSILVDCFDGGRVVTDADMLARSPLSASVSRAALEQKADARTILSRVLRNLVRAHELRGASEANRLPARMLEFLEADQDGRRSRSRFEQGALVRHKRYNYRGVVVEVDDTCQADESWYRNNTSRPERNQPWYYVLVHGTTHVTYAAQASLELDDSSEAVIHPFVPHFFARFEGGRYVRNDRPWPGR